MPHKEKRYYYIKLDERFLSGDTVDYLMTENQTYVLIYIFIINAYKNCENGILAKHVADKVVPCSIDDIQRSCKYWKTPVIKKAIESLKAVNLIYETDADGVLAITDFNKWVGSETGAAERMRELRAKAKEGEQCSNNVTPDTKDEIQETREKEIKNSSSTTNQMSMLLQYYETHVEALNEELIKKLKNMVSLMGCDTVHYAIELLNETDNVTNPSKYVWSLLK